MCEITLHSKGQFILQSTITTSISKTLLLLKYLVPYLSAIEELFFSIAILLFQQTQRWWQSALDWINCMESGEVVKNRKTSRSANIVTEIYLFYLQACEIWGFCIADINCYRGNYQFGMHAINTGLRWYQYLAPTILLDTYIRMQKCIRLLTLRMIEEGRDQIFINWDD